MKALSIRQPWAYAITHGTKRIENRTWYTNYRGPLLIHAGKKYESGAEIYIHKGSPEVDTTEMLAAPRGFIVGSCHLVACIRKNLVATTQRIWADGSWCFVLDNVTMFTKPIPYKGTLGFFNVPDNVLEREALI